MSGGPDDVPESPSVDGGGGLMKKAVEVKSWVVVDAAGRVQQLDAGKHAIMRRTGLQGRDLRILDPSLSCTSTIIGRERAIVVRLEHVKAIIMAQETLLLDSSEPVVVPFVDQIQTRIAHHYNPQEDGDGASNSNTSVRTELQEVKENEDGPQPLPFEFVALEACLEAACGCLETEARTLELEALPALDKLASEVSTLNLELVRQIKSRIISITRRVQKVRSEVENLLDDDQDMAEMYLTRKSQDHSQNTLHSSSAPTEGNMIEDRDSNAANTDLDENPEQSSGSSSIHSSVLNKYLNVAEVERLLEPYFVQIGGTLDKLSTLREAVDYTEDYINLMLDDMQNQMLRLKIILVTAALLLGVFLTISATMAINIGIGVFEDDAHGDRNLFLICIVTTIVLVLAFGLFMLWFRHKRLL